MEAVLMLGWLLIVGGFSYWNWYKITQRNNNIWHGEQLDIRIAVSVAYTFMVYVVCNHSWYKAITMFGFEVLTFGLFFAPLLNLLRHLSWDYISRSNNYDKVLMWVFERVPPIFYYFVLILVSITVGYMFCINSQSLYNLMHGIYPYIVPDNG